MQTLGLFLQGQTATGQSLGLFFQRMPSGVSHDVSWLGPILFSATQQFFLARFGSLSMSSSGMQDVDVQADLNGFLDMDISSGTDQGSQTGFNPAGELNSILDDDHSVFASFGPVSGFGNAMAEQGSALIVSALDSFLTLSQSSGMEQEVSATFLCLIDCADIMAAEESVQAGLFVNSEAGSVHEEMEMAGAGMQVSLHNDSEHSSEQAATIASQVDNILIMATRHGTTSDVSAGLFALVRSSIANDQQGNVVADFRPIDRMDLMHGIVQACAANRSVSFGLAELKSISQFVPNVFLIDFGLGLAQMFSGEIPFGFFMDSGLSMTHDLVDSVRSDSIRFEARVVLVEARSKTVYIIR